MSAKVHKLSNAQMPQFGLVVYDGGTCRIWPMSFIYANGWTLYVPLSTDLTLALHKVNLSIFSELAVITLKQLTGGKNG